MNLQFIKPFYMEDIKKVHYDFLPLFLDEDDEISNYDFIKNDNYREIYITKRTLQNYLLFEGEKQTFQELLLLAKMYSSQYDLNIYIPDETFRFLFDQFNKKTYKGISFNILSRNGNGSLIKYALVCSFLSNVELNREDQNKKEFLEEKKYSNFINRIKENNSDILAMNDQNLIRIWNELVKNIEWTISHINNPEEKEKYYKIAIIEEEMKNRNIVFKSYTHFNPEVK